MSAAHTPGPWGVDEAHVYPATKAIIGYYVSVIDPSQKDGFNGRVGEVFSNCVTGTDDVAHANAKLFSSAPDLLAACNLVMGTFIYPPGSRPEWYQAVRAAVAKANGRAA